MDYFQTYRDCKKKWVCPTTEDESLSLTDGQIEQRRQDRMAGKE